MKVAYTTTCKYTGLVFRNIAECARWQDEPYPPGGTLRVFYNEAGQIVGGPLLEEVSDFKEIES